MRILLLILVSLMDISLSSKDALADQVDEVVVSATRVETLSASTPGNISTIDGEQLRLVAADHIQQALQTIPGVNYQRTNGQESLPAIRTAVQTGAGACGNVLVMEDSLAVRGVGFCNVNELFDTHFENAARVEVVHGPGSAYLGSNSLSGAVNVLLPADGENRISAELGEDGYRRAKLAASTAIGRIYLTATDDDGWRDSSGYLQQKMSWRFARDVADWETRWGLTSTHLSQQTAAYIEGLDSYRDLALSRQNNAPDAFRHSQSTRAWSDWSKTLKSELDFRVRAYLRDTKMRFSMHFLPGDPIEENWQSGFGLQSVLSDQKGNWSLGLDFERSRGGLKQFQQQTTVGSPFLEETIPSGAQYDYRVTASQLASFVEFKWQLRQDLQLFAGLRAEQVRYNYDNRALDGSTRDDGSNCGFGGCRYSRPSDRTDDFSELAPKLELRHSIDEATYWYASVKRSFRVPQATELFRLQRGQQIADIDSVEATNWEIGARIKSEGWYMQMALYRLELDNVITRDSNFYNVDGLRTLGEGIEFSMWRQITPVLRLQLSGTLAQHRYQSDLLVDGVNVDGLDVDTAPEKIFNATINWQPQENWNLQLQWYHTDGYFLDPANEHRYHGHSLLHLRLAREINSHWKAHLRIDNATDKRYAERADYTTFTEERYFPGPPRNIAFEITYSW